MKLFPSTLIIGKNPKLSLECVKTLLASIDHQPDNNPDLFQIDVNSGWSIAVIRSINSFLYQKPYNHSSRAVIIWQVENLETEAQNALLKNLEEPGDNRFFILTTANPKLILSTIISRCYLIRQKDTVDTNPNQPWSIPQDIKKALILADTINTDKSAIKNLLQQQLQINQQLLLTSADPQTAATINLLIYSIDLINHNVDPKSALDYYLLKQI